MNIIKNSLNCDRVDVFEVVENVPDNYIIWNIGENMNEGYLPFATLKSEYEINLTGMKAVKLPPEQLEKMRDAAHYGLTNLKKCKNALNLKPKTAYTRRKKELAEKTIDIFTKIYV